MDYREKIQNSILMVSCEDGDTVEPAVMDRAKLLAFNFSPETVKEGITRVVIVLKLIDGHTPYGWGIWDVDNSVQMKDVKDIFATDLKAKVMIGGFTIDDGSVVSSHS